MTKAFIIAAVSADGFIAKDPDHLATWTSKEDKKRFVELTKKSGVIIMGSTTYKTIGRPLKDRLNIVYSNKGNIPNSEGVEVTNLEPAELLKSLHARGYKEVAICGGSQIYTKFLEAKLVDRIFLTIEPIIFGQGMSLFTKQLEYKLETISSHTTELGSIMNEYKIVYST